MNKYDNLDTFLKLNKSKPKKTISHTRIGNKTVPIIYGGSYNIINDDISEFYKLYYKKVFVQKKHEFITEVQNKEGGPILIDMDFRYDKDVEERPHTPGHIDDIVDLYLTEIEKILELPSQMEFPVFILEKDHVNTENSSYTKDGIHIIIGIHMDHTLQMILRDNVLKNIEDIIGDLPLTNDYSSVLDDGITKGHTNWQLFGSRKPMNEAYKLVKYWSVEWENKEWTYEQNSIGNYMEILPLISARKKDNIKCPMKDSIKEFYKKKKITKKKKKRKYKKIPKNSIVNNWTQISNQEELDKAVENYLDAINQCSIEYHIRETHEFTMILPDKYYNNFNEWIRVGWALHNTDFRMFPTWLKFSSKSDKFSFDDIPLRYEEWMNMKNEGVTERSIMYWAKEAYPEKNGLYQQIKSKTIDYFIEKTLDGETEFDIALVLYHLFKDNFSCPSLKNRQWFEFKKNRWHEIDYGTTLRHLISTKLMEEYTFREIKLVNLLSSGDIDPHSEEAEQLKKKSTKYSNLAIKCKKTVHKNNIMREAGELFFDKSFHNKLDTNTMLMSFKNGVIDFKNKEFRNGKPEDYISLCTNINYVKFDPSDNEHCNIKSEIDDFMTQLFPYPELREYMWNHLASTLIGTNENQTFNIYNGKGSNGKSKLVELMAMCLGDYKEDVPVTLITQKRTSIGQVTPELAKLKGRRYAVMQEPSKGDKINEGMMKQITGGDPMQARALFKDSVTYVPQFTLVVCTNTLFDIKSNDEGTWRRIRVSDFVSHFVDKPKEEDGDPYQYKIDKNLTKKLKRWKPIFISLLVQRAFETQGIVKDCEIVLGKSLEYRRDQDYLAEFMNTMLEKDPDFRPMKKSEVLTIFKEWYSDTYGKGVPKRKELYAYLTKKIGKPTKRGWKGYKIKYDCDED